MQQRKKINRKRMLEKKKQTKSPRRSLATLHLRHGRPTWRLRSESSSCAESCAARVAEDMVQNGREDVFPFFLFPKSRSRRRKTLKVRSCLPLHSVFFFRFCPPNFQGEKRLASRAHESSKRTASTSPVPLETSRAKSYRGYSGKCPRVPRTSRERAP